MAIPSDTRGMFFVLHLGCFQGTQGSIYDAGDRTLVGHVQGKCLPLSYISGPITHIRKLQYLLPSVSLVFLVSYLMNYKWGFIVFCCYYFCLWPIPGNSQGLLWALHVKTIPGGAQVTHP